MAGAEISGKMKNDPILNVFGSIRQELFTKKAVQSKENQDPKRSGKSDPYWKQSGQLHPEYKLLGFITLAYSCQRFRDANDRLREFLT